MTGQWVTVVIRVGPRNIGTNSTLPTPGYFNLRWFPPAHNSLTPTVCSSQGIELGHFNMLINNFIYDNLSAQLCLGTWKVGVDFSHALSHGVGLLPENNEHEVINGVAVYGVFSSVQLLSHVWLCDPMDCSMPGLHQSPTPGVYSNSCPSSRWCHPAISSSVIPFSSCPQSLPASGLFQWVNSSHLWSITYY